MILHSPIPQGAPIAALPLSLCRVRLTLRLLADTTLPAYKGAMLRGGFGYAMQQSLCPQPCWQNAAACPVRDRCPYHRIFEALPSTSDAPLPNLGDAPRAFVLSPPLGEQTQYRAGEPLEFLLTLVGNVIDDLPHFLVGFEQFGKIGLGRFNTPARLERAEALYPWQATGSVVYADGHARAAAKQLPEVTPASVLAQAGRLPAALQLAFPTPLHLKVRGEPMRSFAFPPLIQAIGRRISLLSQIYGGATTPFDYRSLVQQAEQVHAERVQMRWHDWQRTSTRGSTPQTMPMGGLVGSVLLRDVPLELRAMLLYGSLLHVGKGCTFGLGAVEVRAVG